MADKVSKRLVIDASVARATGREDATYPTSVYCRKFLQAVLDLSHRIVMTPDIRDEWNKHQSKFARKWRSQMVAKNKLCFFDIEVDNDLWCQVEAIAESDKEREVMVKDLRLVEAAIATDRTVISLDNKVRQCFAKVAVDVDPLKDIIWVNPAQIAEKPLDWLQNGAEPEIERSLGFQKADN
ncbi:MULTISPECIES: hypothetical protein [unclassified Microcoleus]|uniref:hypothetical protein n=1 Tax=unclassified Microcoleus TaxID=2642155 RepID=UPI002FCF1EC0